MRLAICARCSALTVVNAGCQANREERLRVLAVGGDKEHVTITSNEIAT